MRLTRKRKLFLLVTLFTFFFAGYSYLSGDKDAFSIFLKESLPTPTASKSSPTATPAVLDETIKAAQNIDTASVSRVVDGDTIVLSSGQTLRYIGIDTPETVDPRREVGCFGKEASDKNKELVLGKQVRLEKDVSDTDRYGRLLRYVYVGDQMINEVLVREGYAYATSYPPDIKNQHLFDQAEELARKEGKGLWSSCE